MPHANIWIRRKNWDKWEAMENKAEFINNALNGELPFSTIDVPEPPIVRKISSFTPDKTALPKELEPRFCKNGHPIPYPKEKCLGKGCKYS